MDIEVNKGRASFKTSDDTKQVGVYKIKREVFTWTEDNGDIIIAVKITGTYLNTDHDFFYKQGVYPLSDEIEARTLIMARDLGRERLIEEACVEKVHFNKNFGDLTRTFASRLPKP